MKKLLVIGFIIICSVYCYGQKQGQAKIDSLQAVLKTVQEDTNKVNTLNVLGWELSRTKTDTAILLSTQALQIAEKIKWQLGIGKSYLNLGSFNYLKANYALALEHNYKALMKWDKLQKLGEVTESQILILKSSTMGNIGSIYKDQGDYPKALDYYLKALKIKESLGKKQDIAIIIGNIGIIYKEQGDYPNALDYNFKALKMKEELRDKDGIIKSLSNIGIIYRLQKDYTKTLDYYFKALKLSEEIEQKMYQMNILNNIGNAYFDQKDYDKALDYYNKALKIAEEFGAKNVIAASFSNVGSIYHAKEDYPRALDYYFKGLKMAIELGVKQPQAGLLRNIGEIYFKQNKLKEAAKFLYDGLKLSTEIGDLEGIKVTNGSLSELYSKQGDWKKAYEHYMLAITAKDSINNEEKAKKQTRLEMNYEFDKKQALEKAEHEKELAVAAVETEKKEKEIELLNKDKDIQDLKMKGQESQIKQQSLLAEKKDNDLKLLNQSKEIQSLELQNSESNLVQQKLQTKTKEKEVQLLNKDSDLQLKEIEKQKLTRNAYAGAGVALILLSGSLFNRYRNKQRSNRELEGKNAIITREKERSEELLLNILPSEVAEELKQKGSAEAKQYDDVTVIFTDFKNFTQISETLTPAELVAEIDTCFKIFDGIMGKYNIEKIKTIGDSYMAAGGLPVPNQSHADDVVKAALEIQKFMEGHFKSSPLGKFGGARIGIHTGPVVAGIVGVKKFAYDIWGDTVNIASRMESSSEAGRVNISGSTYQIVKDKFNCTYRGKIKAKNKGEIDMYFVDGLIS